MAAKGCDAELEAVATKMMFVLSEQRSPAALRYLRQANGTARERERHATLLSAIAAMRITQATEFLVTLVESQSLDARIAVSAMLETSPSEETLERLRALGLC